MASYDTRKQNADAELATRYIGLGSRVYAIGNKMFRYPLSWSEWRDSIRANYFLQHVNRAMSRVDKCFWNFIKNISVGYVTAF